MNINYKSDFKLTEVSSIDDITTPFKFKYYGSDYPLITYMVAFDGENYTNCRRLDDGSLLVVFDSHGLTTGRLEVQRKYFLTDSDFRGGLCNKVITDQLDIVLTRGASDGFDATVDVYADYQKGDSGDSAYQVAIKNGFEGSETEWLATLKGDKGDEYIITEQDKEDIAGVIVEGLVSEEYVEEIVYQNTAYISSLTNAVSNVSGYDGLELYPTCVSFEPGFYWWDGSGTSISEGTNNSVQMFWRTIIDITQYTSITFDGLLNGMNYSTSNDYRRSLFLVGDGEYIGMSNMVNDTTPYTVTLSDYEGYEKIEAYITALASDTDRTLFNPAYDNISISATKINDNSSVEVVQVTGESTDVVMSQKAVSDAIDSIESIVGYVDKDIFLKLSWSKEYYRTTYSDLDDPTTHAFTVSEYSSVQKIWGAGALDITDMEKITFCGLNSAYDINGTGSIYSPIQIYLDGVYYDHCANPSTTPYIITVGNLPEHTKAEVYISAKSTSDSEFIPYYADSYILVTKSSNSSLSGLDIVQTRGDSQTDVMSQKAVCDTIESIESIVGYVDKDLFPSLDWSKEYYRTTYSDLDDPTTHAFTVSVYNSVQKIWGAGALDITGMEKITFCGLNNAYSINSTGSIYSPIQIYLDGVYYDHCANPSTTPYTITVSDLPEHTKAEVYISCKSTSDSEFIPYYEDSYIVATKYDVVSKSDVVQTMGDSESNIMSQKAVSDAIEDVVGYADKDLYLALEWSKEWYRTTYSDVDDPTTHDFAIESYSSVQKVWGAGAIDITGMEKLVICGLNSATSVNSTGSIYSPIQIYLDGVYYGHYANPSTTPYTLYLSDLPEHIKAEIYISAKSSSDSEFVPVYDSYILATKASSINEATVPKRVVIVGDSLCGNTSALVIGELNRILSANGYDAVISRTMGGEGVIGNLTRAGGLGVRVTQEATIPATTDSVQLYLGSAWMTSSGDYQTDLYDSISDTGGRPFVIGGCRGSLSKVDSAYLFVRDEAGEPINLAVGAIGWDAALYDDQDYPHIWFTGQNGGYEDEADWASMLSAATKNFGEKFIVCSTPHTRTTNELVREATIKFNSKYINLREYTQGQAVYDGQALGLIDSSYTTTDYVDLFWDEGDAVHQNTLLSYIWAVMMWNRLLELGYVEGERVTAQ
ncbi:MAG: hypothetical protein SNG27_04635 [Rikenellaceae bacterium]